MKTALILLLISLVVFLLSCKDGRTSPDQKDIKTLRMEQVTQDEYDALMPDPDVFYIIIEKELPKEIKS